jgi:copper chaperone
MGTMSQTWTVSGMTCAHCVDSVTEEVAELPGVSSVDVVLATGVLSVEADPPLDQDAVRTAVEEAGYRLA